MELRKEEYSGDIHKKVYVSAEKGRKHIANNPAGQYEVRQYRLDGNIVKNMMCCDYLLLNDSYMNAYYIELKGSDIAHAVEQLEAGLRIFKESLRHKNLNLQSLDAFKEPWVKNGLSLKQTKSRRHCKQNCYFESFNTVRYVPTV